MRKTKRRSILKSYEVAFSPDGASLVTLGRDVVMWDASRYAKLWRAHPLSHPMHIAFSPDSTRLAVKSTSGRIVVIDPASGSTVVDFKNEADGEGGRLAFSPDGDRLVDCTWKGSHVVRKLDGRIEFRAEFYPDLVVTVLRRVDGQYWFRHERRIAASGDGVAMRRLLRRDWPFSGDIIEEIALPLEWVTCAALSPRGDSLAAVSRRPDRLTLFDFPSMRVLADRLSAFSSSGNSLAYSPDGQMIAVVCKDSVALLRCNALEEVGRHSIELPWAVAFSPDGVKLAIGSGADGEVIDLSNCMRASQGT